MERVIMAGIPDDLLDGHKYVLMYDDERVADAVVALRDSKGYDWWYLVVDLTDGQYAVATFGDLQKPLQERGAAFLETPLSALVGSVIKRVETAEKDTITVNEAQERADHVPGRAIVILTGGEFRGVLPLSIHRGLFESSLVQLAGEYAPLPQQGLYSARRLQSRKTKSGSSAQN
jgi:hypothetical protein